MGCSYQLLKDCAPPEPLSGGDQYKLCSEGYFLNFQHAEAQLLETAANAEMSDASGTANHEERFERLKVAVVERHEVMKALFGHVKDCYICSVGFGLTPAPKPRPERKPFAQILARWTRAAWLSRMKTGLQRT
jgi:hypothetical protein